MNIMILGLGVIATTYAYTFQKAGHKTYHLVREEKQAACPKSIRVKLLDGRTSKKGEDVADTYSVALAQPGSTYDLVLVSVSSNKLEAALETIRQKDIRGTILLLNGIREDRAWLEAIMAERPYLLGYPVAGGHLDLQTVELDCVLFDHILLEQESKTHIGNYAAIRALFQTAGIGVECPYDMLEWIWLHMAINAGVISTAATLGDLSDSAAAARRVMDSAASLKQAIYAIRECLRVVEARGVRPEHYKNDLLPYKLPAGPAALLMKHMFRTNRLTRRIMELHANKDDLLYVCGSIHDQSKRLHVAAPLFERSYAVMVQKLEADA